MENNITPLILAGGSGSRLWPLSRKQYPKQFLKITGDSSMLQKTLLRTTHLNAPLLVCSQEHRFLVAGQLDELNMQTMGILLEPCAKNTAAAVAVGALKLQREQGPEAIMLVLPADHEMDDSVTFKQAINAGAKRAAQGEMVVFGIEPNCPETQFGYIEVNDKKSNGVRRFVEKPDLAKAENFIASGNFFWNSGILICQVSRYLSALEKNLPETHFYCMKALKNATIDQDFTRLSQRDYLQITAVSLDYAVLEHEKDLSLIPLEIEWNDMGSWSALCKKAPKDAHNNSCFGDVVLQDCSNSLVYSDNRLVTALGVNDLIIVDTKDAVFVTTREQAHKVKELVATLAEQGRIEHAENRQVYRPWGCFDSIERGENYQVKHLTVKPGERLSLQMHYHRAEHWVVVSGSAIVQCGDEQKMVAENESVYIAKGTTHSLENPGKIPLHVIEIQSGSYLGEDDIVRFLDKYNRLQDVAS